MLINPPASDHLVSDKRSQLGASLVSLTLTTIEESLKS